jgi:hypothetical protein
MMHAFLLGFFGIPLLFLVLHPLVDGALKELAHKPPPDGA